MTPEQEVERAFQVLSTYGVSRERARSVSNGIEVLGTRYTRQVGFLNMLIAELRTEIERLQEGFSLIAQQSVCPDLWPEEIRKDWTEMQLAYRTALVIAEVMLDPDGREKAVENAAETPA